MNIITPEQILLAWKRNNEIIIAFSLSKRAQLLCGDRKRSLWKHFARFFIVPVADPAFVTETYMCAQSNFQII